MKRRLLVILVGSMAALMLPAASAYGAAPKILSASFSDVTTTSATLKAEIDPEERATFYRFEYGTAPCSTVPNPCTPVPVPDGVIAKKDAPEPVKADLEGLTPGTTYHFRVLASNPDGNDVTADRTFATYALPPVFGPCPNDALRTAQNPMAAFIEHLGENLPDCRAYEQASPLDKNGVDIKGLPMWVKASPEGDALSFVTTSGIPGGVGAQELPPSLSSKGLSNWSTRGMLPPANMGQEAFVLGWTPDFSRIFSSAKLFDPPTRIAFLSRSSADGSIEEVVPHSTAMKIPNFAGSSPDGSVVVFESKAKLLPAAIAGASNVYAWDRASKALRLAGVFNEGEAPPEGAFAGPYDWGAGEDGVDRGGAALNYYLQDQNAVSTDGTRVYFTEAGTGQLYLRLNATKAQSPLVAGACDDPAKACTLHVSKSQKTEGGGPGGTDASGTRPAAFMGASADGSVAYLTSSEMLTNDANTGPEPPPASIATAPKDGDPVDLDFLPAKAAGIAIGGEFIYWANPEGDSIERAKLDGLSDSEVLVTGLEDPQYVAVDSEHVYWTATGELDEEGKPQDGQGLVGRAKLTLTGVEDPDPDFITGTHNPQGIAVNAEHVFWANTGSKVETRTIGRAKVEDGGGANQAFIQVDLGGGVNHRPQGIAINSSHIYVAVNSVDSQSYLFRYDLAGTNEKFVFDSQHLGLDGLRGIALDSEFVYWARQGQDSVGRVPIADFGTASSCAAIPSCKPKFIPDAGRPYGLTAGATDLYWSANQGSPPNAGNELYRYEAGGGLTEVSLDSVRKDGADVQGVLGVSEDGSRVYFAANGIPDGTINSPNGRGEVTEAGDCKGTISDTGFNYTGQCNLYLAEEGKAVRFIARLDAGGAGSDAFNWLPHGATVDLEKSSRVSADGATLLFRSQRQLTAYANEGTPQLYRYRAGDTAPTCVSCNPTGEEPLEAPTLGTIGMVELIPSNPAYTLSRNLSANGNRAFFESSDRLAIGDTNGEDGCEEAGTEKFSSPTCQDVYMWEAQGTGSCKENVQGGGCLYLLSSGQSPEASFFTDASTDGDEAFLITRSRLVGQDQDQLYDAYDAGVNGGLSAQNQSSPVVCLGEACKPAPPAPPGFESPATPGFQGPGNVKPKPRARCPKGKRRVRSKGGKARCVRKRGKQQRSKGKSRRRAAKTTGRAK